LFVAISFVFGLAGSANAVSPNTIAIRVISNPKHYSALHWYQEQKFTGSPQSSSVDGYEAVRDGRTVYVDVGNVEDSNNDGVNDVLYTNIYLISYDQKAEGATVDIFGRMLQHWKFNTNLAGNAGSCSITAADNCVYSSDCPRDEFCLSDKAKVIRDTRRLADLADLGASLENFYSKNGYYPQLASGSYLPDKTISVWPSWEQTLGSELGIITPVDPINKLGDCGGAQFDPVTCWDDNAKSFAVPGAASLPLSSHAYLYSTDASGSAYDLNLNFEAGTLDAAGNYHYTH